jgi:hypothetical protein
VVQGGSKQALDTILNNKDKIPKGKGELGFNKISFVLLNKLKVTKIYIAT